MITYKVGETMHLIKGDDLNFEQREQVRRTFVYRWTIDNQYREQAWRETNQPIRPTIPLKTDLEWLHEHAFWFINDGSRLAKNKHAEPAYVAD